MPRHPDTLRALALTIRIQAQLLHRLIIEREPLHTLVEAVVHGVGGDVAAVVAVARAEALVVCDEVLIVVIVTNLDNSVKRRLQWLAVVPVATIQEHCV